MEPPVAVRTFSPMPIFTLPLPVCRPCGPLLREPALLIFAPWPSTIPLLLLLLLLAPEEDKGLEFRAPAGPAVLIRSPAAMAMPISSC